MDLELRFGPHLVGVIEGAFWSDYTGYGVFRPSAELEADPALQQVRSYIAFSEDWNRRNAAGVHEHSSDEMDAFQREWDAFLHVAESTRWHTVAPDGTGGRIAGPVFLEGEVTWGPADESTPVSQARE